MPGGRFIASAPVQVLCGAEKLGRWPAAVGLFVFVWIELASGWSEDPPVLATAIVGYTVLTLVAQAVYGVETWTERGEAFAVYFNLFARLSIFETRDGVVGVRRPLGGLPGLEQMPGTVAFATVMIGTVSFDGLSLGAPWQDISSGVVDTLGSSTRSTRRAWRPRSACWAAS